MNQRSRIVAEVAVVCAVFAASAMWASTYWDAWTRQGGKPVFYQSYFEPAVMIACGRGFVASSPQPAALSDFLEQRRDSISCADVPADPSQLHGRVFQRPTFYLMWFVGLAWRVLGVSWSGLGPAFGVLFGVSSGFVYGLGRLAMGRVLALFVVFGVATSTLQLWHMPHLRDFAKEPFTLALFFILGLLVTRPARPGWVVGLAAAYGIVLGVAYGFRTDFLIDIPLLLIVLVLFLEGGPVRNIRMKLAACTAFAGAFAAAGWPVLTSVYHEGGCQWHTAILGLQSPFDNELLVQPALYDVGYAYGDGYVYAQVANFAARTLPPHPPIRYCSPEYDAQSGRYFRALVTRFPADVMTRAYASARTLAEAPFLVVYPPVRDWMAPFFVARGALLKPLRGSGIWLVAIATCLAGAWSLRLGLLLVVFALYVGGYPAIQFAARHYFHLESLVWVAAGFVVQQAVTAGWNAWRSRTLALPGFRAGASRLAATAACALAIIVLPLQVLRAYQTTSVRPLLESYVAAPKASLSPASAAPDGAVMLASRPIGPFDGDVVEVDVDRARCGADAAVTFSYDPAFPSSNFTRTVAIPPGSASSGLTRVFVAVFEHFEGVQFPAPMTGCVAGAYRLTDLRPFDVLVNATLTPGWDSLPLHQTLRRWAPAWSD